METLPIARPPATLDRLRAASVGLHSVTLTRCKVCGWWWWTTPGASIGAGIDHHHRWCQGAPNSIYRGTR